MFRYSYILFIKNHRYKLQIVLCFKSKRQLIGAPRLGPLRQRDGGAVRGRRRGHGRGRGHRGGRGGAALHPRQRRQLRQVAGVLQLVELRGGGEQLGPVVQLQLRSVHRHRHRGRGGGGAGRGGGGGGVRAEQLQAQGGLPLPLGPAQIWNTKMRILKCSAELTDRLFWNQVLTWVSERPSLLARPPRSSTLRYLCCSKVASSSCSWPSEKAVLAFLCCRLSCSCSGSCSALLTCS